MKTYVGWYLEATTYLDREDVPRTEIPDTVEGAVMIRYDNVSKSRIKTPVIEMNKITQVIDTDTRVDVKPDDRINTEHGWLRVEWVERYVPDDKLSVVRMWPNRRSRLEIKRVYLA